MMRTIKMMMMGLIMVVCVAACNDDEGNTQICKKVSAISDPFPESGPNCLFPEEKIWEINAPQTIEVEFTTTGDAGIDIVFEHSNGQITERNLAAVGSLPQFNTLTDEIEDVIAVFVRCDYEAANGCTDCRYDYKICIK